MAGISRSATIVIAYIMATQKLTADAAFKLVKSKRVIVSPNMDFMGALMREEKNLKSMDL
jgi:protein-tyrosine phosphatase